jgi:hypothetical protein
VEEVSSLAKIMHKQAPTETKEIQKMFKASGWDPKSNRG